jgi:hypothetical protein
MKRVFCLFVSICCLMTFSGVALSADFQIKDYVFTWTVFKAPDLKMDIVKKPEGVMVVLASPGGKLGRISAAPEQAKAIGEVLKKTQEYYKKQMSQAEPNANDLVEVGDFKVSFTSSRGRNFGVSVTTAKVFSSAVKMSREGALAVSPYLCQAPDMTAYMNERINP